MKKQLFFTLLLCFATTVKPAAYSSTSADLIEAARHGNRDEVKRLARQPFTQINQIDALGKTALIAASEAGHIDIVDFLARQPFASINQSDALGKTALVAAYDAGHMDIVEYLKRRPSIIIDPVVNQPRSMRANNRPDNLVDPINRFQGLHITPRHGSLQLPTHDALPERLEAPRAAPRTDESNVTAILREIQQSQHVPMVPQLPTDDAPPSYESAMGAHAVAAVEDWSQSGALIMAAATGDIPKIKELANSRSLNERDSQGRTPLMAAAANGHLDAIRYITTDRLFTSGHFFMSDQEDNQGRTPLMMAAANGHIDVVRHITTDRLFRPGRLFMSDEGDNQGRTPLMAAAANGHIDVVKALTTDRFFIPNQKDKQGKTAITMALANGHLEVAGYLAAHGAK